MIKARFPLLFIILCLTSQVVLSKDWLYTVRPGDTIWNLCGKYTNRADCWYRLGDYNGVDYPTRLPPGFKIKIPIAWLKRPPKPVLVKHVRGEAFFYTAQQSDQLVLKVGDKLSVGSTIVTKDSHVSLEFADGATLILEPQSELKLNSLSVHEKTGMVDSSLRLERGAVKAKVPRREHGKNRFEITTPAAVAAVRGTEFRVSSDDQQDKATMRGEVFTGLVDVSADLGRHDVAAGFGIQAREGEELQPPRKLLPAPVFSDDFSSSISVPYTVHWSSLSGAKSYGLQVFLDAEGNKLLQEHLLTQSQHVLDNLKKGCYRLKAYGVDDIDLQGLSGETKVCISDFLATPELTSKEPRILKNNDLGLKWKKVQGADYYLVQVAADPEFKNIIIEKNVRGDGAVLRGLVEKDKRLYIRLQAVSKGGNRSDFSEVIMFHSSLMDLVVTVFTSALVGLAIF